MRVFFRSYDSKMASREKLFRVACDFANKIGQERLINITHSEDRDNIVITVWYWGEEEEKDAPVKAGKGAVPAAERPAAAPQAPPVRPAAATGPPDASPGPARPAAAVGTSPPAPQPQDVAAARNELRDLVAGFDVTPPPPPRSSPPSDDPRAMQATPVVPISLARPDADHPIPTDLELPRAPTPPEIGMTQQRPPAGDVTTMPASDLRKLLEGFDDPEPPEPRAKPATDPHGGSVTPVVPVVIKKDDDEIPTILTDLERPGPSAEGRPRDEPYLDESAWQ
jgi:hypothetical protein